MEEVDNNTQQNSVLYKDIIKLWDKGWEAENDENNNRCKEAKECFQEAENKLNEALQLMPNNSEYIKLSKMVELKIQGNTYFNKGILLGNEANHLILENNTSVGNKVINVTITKYKEARAYLVKAQDCFTQGQKYNEYFQSCLHLVQQDLEIITSVIQDVENMMVKNLGDTNIVVLSQQFTEMYIHDNRSVEQMDQCIDFIGSTSDNI